MAQRSWITPAALVCVASACTGDIGDTPAEETSAADCGAITPGDSPIRRMTREEYDATIRDLLGDDSHPASGFVAEEESLGFLNQAAVLTVTQLLAEQYMSAAEDIALRAVAGLGALIPDCDAAVDGEDVCAAMWIEQFGKRAFRRPLEADELARYQALFTHGRDTTDYATGIRLVLQALLQSPHFLYRVEFGAPDPALEDVVALTPYEIASRLSYLLWSSMPDDELFLAAEAGELATPEGIAAQARRMLEDDKARTAVRSFHRQWLGLARVDEALKDGAAFAAYDDALLPLWKQETEAFLEHVVFDAEGDLPTMFSAPYSMMNAELATFYGAQGPSGEAFEKVALDPQQRAGFLTHAGILAANANFSQTSPVLRGKLVREQLLCQPLNPPPDNVDITPPEIDPNATTRERLAQHSELEACSGCHQFMDPIGLGLEKYDAIGLYRETEGDDLPIDASGEIVSGGDASGAFDGGLELVAKLAESETVRQCVATQWFRFGQGRAEGPDDECTLLEIQEAFASSGYDIKELLVALTQTDAFIYRKAVVAGEGESQ